tara:strand:- start:518 stop:817 length:300 start_codon:yes stop_codon:yes gene_type:complete
LGKKLNKIREKKLNSIKSEIEEIKNVITSNNNTDISANNDSVDLKNNLDNTLTLTKIITKDDGIYNNYDLNEIKNELKLLKSTISNQENLLREILLKIK